MALNIRNRTTEELAATLARLTGESGHRRSPGRCTTAWNGFAAGTPAGDLLADLTRLFCIAPLCRSSTAGRQRTFSCTTNAVCWLDSHRHVGAYRNPPAGIIVIPSIPRNPSSNVAMNSAPCRCAAATMAASAKLSRAAPRVRNSRSVARKRSEQGRKSTSSASSRISATSSAARCPHLASNTVTTSRNTYSINRSRPKSPRRRDSMADAAAA